MNGFTFFRNYYEAINDPDNELSEEEQGRLYNAIFAYIFDGTEPELKGACRMAFNLIRPSLDKSRRNSKNASGKNETDTDEEREESETEATQKRNESETEANASENENRPFFEKKEREEEREVRKEKEEGCEKSARAREDTPLEQFLKRWQVNSNAIGNYSGGKLAGIDWDKVSEQVEKSAFLQQQKGIAFFVTHYAEIIDGSYTDFHPPRRTRRVNEDALEAKKREFDELRRRKANGST